MNLRLVLAALPILIVLVLMIGFKWSAARSGPVGWLAALAIATVFFGAGLDVLAYSQVRSILMSIYVLYIVWMALVFYYTLDTAGVIDRIGEGISSLTGDRILQLIILSWVFSSFLQGIAGYGVPVAIASPLLITLGFSPVIAVTAIAVGHSWSVTFGSIAASFNAMVSAAGMEAGELAPWSAIQLGVVCLLCGIAAVYTYDGWKAVRHGLPAILIIGSIMAGVQYAAALSSLSNLAAFLAGSCGLVSACFIARMKRYSSSDGEIRTSQVPDEKNRMPYNLAFLGYLILIVIVGVAEVVPQAGSFLDSINISLQIPETSTSLGFIMPGAPAKKISVLGHPGALLAYASLINFLIFLRKKHLSCSSVRQIFSKVSRSGLASSIGVISMVGFAMIMEQSGMTSEIALGLSKAGKMVYPVLSPFIGVLGAFMTGSNTNSNVVFTALQKHTALLLNLPVAIILAAQTTGGSIGGMLAPARIIVGCSTAGLSGQEGLVISRTIRFGLLIALVTGLLTLVACVI